MIFRFVFLALIFSTMGTQEIYGDVFRFVVTSDTRGDVYAKKCADNNSGISPVLKPALESVLEVHKNRKIDLFLFPGDMIAGYNKRDTPSAAVCNKEQLSSWKQMMQVIPDSGIRLQVTLGNHEVIAMPPQGLKKCGEHLSEYVPSVDNLMVAQEILADYYGGNAGPASDYGFTYSFDMGPCHFTVLNSYTMLHANSFSEETMRWLMDDLAKAKEGNKKLFVISHAPAFPGSRHMWGSLPLFDPTYNCDGYDPRFGIDRRTERDRFWNILKSNNVTAYFCGHEHNTQIQLVEGVWHVLAGGLTKELYPLNGALNDKRPNTALYDGKFQNPRATTIWPWDENKKSYWGWCLISVEGDGIKLEVYGNDTLPTKGEDFKILKTFELSK